MSNANPQALRCLAEPLPLSNSCTSVKKVRAKLHGRINSYAKGHRSENKCAEIFLNASFAVHKSIRVKFQNIDVFGLFDLVCFKKGFPKYFIQVKSNETPRNKLKNALLEFAQKFGDCNDRFEIWSVYDRRGIRRWSLGPQGWFEIKGFPDIPGK